MKPRLRILASSAILILALLLATVPSASALSIIRNFFGTAGGAPTTVAGGGNLTDIFNAAADWWELAILDVHTVTLDFGWFPFTGSTLGGHSLQAQGGTPNRETAGSIGFDNDGTTSWFLDSTPHDNSEYLTFTATTANLGGGQINVGRVFTDPVGDAVGRLDLLSVAKHEIGHTLGMSAANVSYQNETGLDDDIDVTAPRLFAGTVIPTTNFLNPEGFNAHLTIGPALMFPSTSVGVRRIQSAVDILANAEISEFNSLNLNPAHTIPEPSTLFFVGSGLGSLSFLRWRWKVT